MITMEKITPTIGVWLYLVIATLAETLVFYRSPGNYSTEIALAATPGQLLDRINLLLMAGEMDSTLQSQILSAVNSIAIPSSGQSAINAALLARVETAIYLTMASPSYAAQF